MKWRANRLKETRQKLGAWPNQNFTDKNYPLSTPHLFYDNNSIDLFNSHVYSITDAPKVVVPAYDIVLGSPPLSLQKKIMAACPKKCQRTRGVLKQLEVAEGLRYELNQNVDCPDGLANGAGGILKKIDYRIEISTRPSIWWLQFDDTSVGEKKKKEYSHLYRPEINKSWTPILETSVQFQVLHWKNNHIMRHQFPLRMAAAKSIPTASI